MAKETPAAADGVLTKLLGIGFDEAAARYLANCFPAEAIDQQLEWLPWRRADTNRLGLLRRAIEGNWPRPEASLLPPEYAPGAVFVRHFQATLHGSAESPITCLPKEAEQATVFLRALDGNADGAGNTEAQAANWGRRFGRFVRTKPPTKPWFLWILRAHGGEFLQSVGRAVRGAEKRSEAQARRTHEQRFTRSYHVYLRDQETRLRREEPALYAAFEAYREQLHDQFRLSEQTRELLRSETSRLCALVEFLRERAVHVLDFWAWDWQFNTDGWSKRSEREGQQAPTEAESR